MRAASDASRAASKWATRASIDPFSGASADSAVAQSGAETAALSPDRAADGKENRIPSSGHPNVAMSRGRRQSLLEAQLFPPELNFAASASSSLLGKRPNRGKHSSVVHRAIDASHSDGEADSDADRAARDPLVVANAVTHFEARALELHGTSLEPELEQEEADFGSGAGSATMLVDDFSHVGQLRFGAVALGERRSRQLTLENASELGNARVKYEGYALVGVESAAVSKPRFRCDLHVCVVDALKSVTLRVTFEPQPSDVGRDVTAMLKFTVNDRFKLQCRATSSVKSRVPKVPRFGRSRPAKAVDAVVVASREKQIEYWYKNLMMRSVIDARIQHKLQLYAAAQRMQIWWLGLCCKWGERQRLAEENHQREMEAMAMTMVKARAARIVGSWIRQKVIIPYRERNFHFGAVRKLQAWWRGTLVRVHHSSPEVTQQRKKLSTMKLVGQEQRISASTSSSTSLQQLRVNAHEGRNVQTEQPQTLGSRLDMALHMLLHGKRLQDMLFASHTIEVCTRYSRECCRKCVQLQISSTIFAAIRGLNRSRPHVELLHQLLLVLQNLTVYRRSVDKIKLTRVVATDDGNDRLDVDLRALDTLVDLLHIHRDMHHVFILSADVIKYYLCLLKPLAGRNHNVQESWSEADKRLSGLQELLSRKLALYNATASFRRVNNVPEMNSANSLMRKMNPKTAVSIMEQLVVLLER
ncbi:abnormal spindle-like microcephaly-associated protein [Phytophthora cinnamomi]|uniref:abnormal spindle-like microcephaly-associated protein n=1 Tax=Phytophthora cinnamomi TaxID=4785 RepID=UPI0035596925|nr:abnormal spindle-like microcephaly-associated protein [Phytophthora cinnamomi]